MRGQEKKTILRSKELFCEGAARLRANILCSTEPSAVGAGQDGPTHRLVAQELQDVFDRLHQDVPGRFNFLSSLCRLLSSFLRSLLLLFLLAAF